MRALAESLRAIGDLERILARIASAFGAAARSCAAARGARCIAGSAAVAARRAGQTPSPLLQQLLDEFGDHRDEHALLARAVVESPPHFLRDGGVIAAGLRCGARRAARCSAATPSSSCSISSGASANAAASRA